MYMAGSKSNIGKVLRLLAYMVISDVTSVTHFGKLQN